MSAEAAVRRFLLVLGTENRLLAGGATVAAAALVSEKQAAAAVLVSALRDAAVPHALLAELQGVVEENAERLRHAMAVQSRILELVARATAQASERARMATSYGRPGARSGVASRGSPLALALRT